MDPLDALMRDLTLTEETGKVNRNRQRTKLHVHNENETNTLSTSATCDTEPKRFNISEARKIEEELKTFIVNLADTQNVLRLINVKLGHIRFDKFMEYYLQRQKMISYFETEVWRMTFHVVSNGQTYSSVDEVLSIYESCKLRDIWRLANQSIYAEILSALQSSFMKPELSISVISTSSVFSINLDRDVIRAESAFRFVTLRGDYCRTTSLKTTDTELKEKLELGSASGIVEVDLHLRMMQQKVETPVLKVVFDEEIR
jgi:hypothetical protein